MSAAAMKITEAAKDLQEAVTPSFSKDDLRKILSGLDAIQAGDPREAFGHTVGEQRKGIAAMDETIGTLNFISTPAMRGAEGDAELNRRVQKAIRAACRNLRVTRALMCMLAGEKAPQDEASDILEDAKKLVEERAAANVAKMDEEERVALHAIVDDTSELDRWLSDS